MNIRRILIVFVLILSLACNIVSQVPVITPTSTLPAASLTPILPTSTPPYIPTECAGLTVGTPLPAKDAALPTPSVGANPPLSQSEQLQLFEELTSPIPEYYVYPDFNGLDWPSVVAKYRLKVEAGLDTEAFYSQMQNLINELGDNHSQYLSSAEVAASDAQLAGKNNYVGIGVEILPMPEKGRLSLLLVFPGSSAKHAGLKTHDSLLAVDGRPLVENGQLVPQLVRGPECSTTVLTVQSPGGAPRNVTLVRYDVKTSIPVDAEMVTTQDGSRIGYIYLPSFFNETFPEQVRQALEQFGQLDGLILDNRMNSGGSSDVLEPIMSYFTDGVLGHFTSRSASRPLRVSADPVNNSQTVPMVVLVGVNTVSFGEIFSGVLQDIARAKVVGQTTLGNVEILHSHKFSDGSLLWLAEERFIPLHSQANWEQTGIIPDVQAYADWDTFTFESDPSIAAAVKLLGHQ
jgi:carboxyl-terminal processing protease